MGDSSLKMNVKVSGVPETVEALRGVKQGVGNRVLVGALRKQAGKGAKIAKGDLEAKRTGLLGKAIGWIFRKPKRASSGGGVFIIGPRKSFATVIGYVPSAGKRLFNRLLGRKTVKSPKVSKTVTKQFAGQKVDPCKYAHLVEGGRKGVGPRKKHVMSDGTTIFGKHAVGVPARPFMKPAAAAIASSAPGEIAADVAAGVSREAAKYAAKGKSIYGGPPS